MAFRQSHSKALCRRQFSGMLEERGALMVTAVAYYRRSSYSSGGLEEEELSLLKGSRVVWALPSLRKSGRRRRVSSAASLHGRGA